MKKDKHSFSCSSLHILFLVELSPHLDRRVVNEHEREYQESDCLHCCRLALLIRLSKQASGEGSREGSSK